MVDRVAELEAEVAALREACELAWTIIGAEPNVSPRARSSVLARIQQALRGGVFADVDGEP